jgi:hypothetical protein
VVLEAGGSSPLGHPTDSAVIAIARLNRASSSIWQSNGLLIRRFGVRVPGGPPTNALVRCSAPLPAGAPRLRACRSDRGVLELSAEPHFAKLPIDCEDDRTLHPGRNQFRHLVGKTDVPVHGPYAPFSSLWPSSYVGDRTRPRVRRSARKTRKAVPFLRERRADRGPRGLAPIWVPPSIRSWLGMNATSLSVPSKPSPIRRRRQAPSWTRRITPVGGQVGRFHPKLGNDRAATLARRVAGSVAPPSRNRDSRLAVRRGLTMSPVARRRAQTRDPVNPFPARRAVN